MIMMAVFLILKSSFLCNKSPRTIRAAAVRKYDIDADSRRRVMESGAIPIT